jgi:tripartite-type tricarboxylate transporter receptor subunit TctC
VTKRFVASAVIAVMAMLALAAAPVMAQDYPQRPIHIIVSFGAGGGADIVARIIGQSMQDRLGQGVVIENKPGAGGTLGNDFVARAAPDGYTIGIMTAGQIIAAVLQKSLHYDTLTAFDSLGQVATASLLIVTRPDFPANDVKGLIAAAKANPGKITFGSPGFGATQHLAGELFKQTAGIDFVHVPFRSSPEAISAVLSKQVDVIFDTVTAVIGQVQSGQLKALAVTGKDRFPAVSNVPTVIESGGPPGYDVTTWYGFFAPHGTPPEIVAKLNKTLNDVIADDAARERLSKAGVIVQGSTPEAFGGFMAAEYARWEKVRVAAGIEKK